MPESVQEGLSLARFRTVLRLLWQLQRQIDLEVPGPLLWESWWTTCLQAVVKGDYGRIPVVTKIIARYSKKIKKVWGVAQQIR
jgi:hypothetical protein